MGKKMTMQGKGVKGKAGTGGARGEREEGGLVDYSPPISDTPPSNPDLQASTPPPKRAGRKRKLPLTYDFFTFRTREGRPLKKETLRVQHIRGVKYLIRCVLADRLPTRKAIRFQHKHTAKSLIWDILKVIVRRGEDGCRGLAKVREGPATEGVAARRDEGVGDSGGNYRSHNDEYCRGFYRQPTIRMIHFLYMQLVFDCGDIDPARMCEKLRVKCCNSTSHTDVCRIGWESLSWFLTFTIIEDLGLSAYGAHAEKCLKYTSSTKSQLLAVMGSERLFVLHPDLQ